jgi:hypothetical protein
MQTPIPAVSFPEAVDAAAAGLPPASPPAVRGWTPRVDWRGHVDWGEAADVHMRASSLHEQWRFGVVHFTDVRPGGAAFTVVPRSCVLPQLHLQL